MQDLADHVVYPPVPGWFSWNRQQVDFPSGYPLGAGSNPLYFLVESSGGDLQSLTDATVDLSFYPQNIMAAGFMQAYDVESGTPKFGAIMPPGAILMWGSSTIPSGWALCDGTQSSESTVHVPDLTDKFVLGAGGSETVGESGQADTHTHTVSNSTTFTTTTEGDHSHLMPQNWYNRNLSSGKWTGIDRHSDDVMNSSTTTDGAHSHQVNVALDFRTETNDGGIRPSWYALCFIIKL